MKSRERFEEFITITLSSPKNSQTIIFTGFEPQKVDDEDRGQTEAGI